MTLSFLRQNCELAAKASIPSHIRNEFLLPMLISWYSQANAHYSATAKLRTGADEDIVVAALSLSDRDRHPVRFLARFRDESPLKEVAIRAHFTDWECCYSFYSFGYSLRKWSTNRRIPLRWFVMPSKDQCVSRFYAASGKEMDQRDWDLLYAKHLSAKTDPGKLVTA